MIHPVGSKFSYQSHGVGQVSQESDGTSYTMWFPLKRSYITVYDPSLLVPVIDKGRADALLELLASEPPKPFPAAWINRRNGYIEKMKSGCVEDVAEVVRDLGTKKKLSYGEIHIYQTCFCLLASQVKEVYPDAEKRIKDAYLSRG